MKTLLLLAIMLYITSCASVKLSDLQPTTKTAKLLPSLEPKIDVQSLEGVYTHRYSVAATENEKTRLDISSKTNIDIQDVITIFNKDVKNNICKSDIENKGYIVCRIPAGIIKQTNEGLGTLSAFTFGFLNLAGMPVTNYKTALDVEVEIYDNSHKLLAQYSSEGFYRAWIGVYYGYSFSSAPRISNIKAFKLAMDDIKKQIEKDADKLITALDK